MKLLLLLAFLFYAANVLAQNQHKDSPFEFYRFYLKEPALELIELKYENTCEPADDQLQPCGQSVLIRNYKPHQRMYVRLRNVEGTITEIINPPATLTLWLANFDDNFM